MDMEVTKYISQNVLILIPFLYVIGMLLKSTEKINDKYIPFILLAVAEPSCLYLIGINFNSIIQGVLVTGATVYVNQIYKQVTTK